MGETRPARRRGIAAASITHSTEKGQRGKQQRGRRVKRAQIQQAQQQGDGQAGKRDGGGRAQQGEQQRFAAKDAANLPAGSAHGTHHANLHAALGQVGGKGVHNAHARGKKQRKRHHADGEQRGQNLVEQSGVQGNLVIVQAIQPGNGLSDLRFGERLRELEQQVPGGQRAGLNLLRFARQRGGENA